MFRRIQAWMQVTTNPQRTLWEAVLPPGHQDLPAQLARVDALLDDPVACYTPSMLSSRAEWPVSRVPTPPDRTSAA